MAAPWRRAPGSCHGRRSLAGVDFLLGSAQSLCVLCAQPSFSLCTRRRSPARSRIASLFPGVVLSSGARLAARFPGASGEFLAATVFWCLARADPRSPMSPSSSSRYLTSSLAAHREVPCIPRSGFLPASSPALSAYQTPSQRASSSAWPIVILQLFTTLGCSSSSPDRTTS
jgi:hypothetical protein